MCCALMCSRPSPIFVPEVPKMKLAFTQDLTIPGAPGAKVPTAIRVGDRVWLSGANALRGDGAAVPIDANAQTHLALDQLEAALKAVGGTLANVTKLTTCIVDRGYRVGVYRAIAERIQNDARPVSTGLVVAGLPSPDLVVQIDAEAYIPAEPATYVRPYDFDKWFGQDFSWRGSMVVVTEDELFVRGQTGATLDHRGAPTTGRSLASAQLHARHGMENVRQLLEEAGGSLEDVTRINVYLADRAYRKAIYPEIGKAFGEVHPCSTGVITTAFAREDILWEIDVVAVRRKNGEPHKRHRKYHSSMAKYGTETQSLDCKFSMIIEAGNRVILRGQTGMGLDEKLYGAGDVAAQTQKAMDNVVELLGEVGTSLKYVVKGVIYVTESDYIPVVNRIVIERFGTHLPALTTVVAKGLASPELLMEIDITAVKPEG